MIDLPAARLINNLAFKAVTKDAPPQEQPFPSGQRFITWEGREMEIPRKGLFLCADGGKKFLLLNAKKLAFFS
jgi:hypothetical protein